MPDPLTSLALGIISALVGIIAILVRKQNGKGWNGQRERRVGFAELRDDLRDFKRDLLSDREDVRREWREMRATVEALVMTVARHDERLGGLTRDVDELRRLERRE